MWCLPEVLLKRSDPRTYMFIKMNLVHMKLMCNISLRVCRRCNSRCLSAFHLNSLLIDFVHHVLRGEEGLFSVNSNSIVCVSAGLCVDTSCDRETSTSRFPGWGDGERRPKTSVTSSTLPKTILQITVNVLFLQMGYNYVCSPHLECCRLLKFRDWWTFLANLWHKLLFARCFHCMV